MKRMIKVLGVALALVLPAAALAYAVDASQTVTLPKGQTKAGTYYATGQTVTIDGDVDGDLICAGQTVNVNGAVHGDVICGGQNVTVNGPVDGSVRAAAQTVDINGTVGRNVTALGQTVALGAGARVAGDVGLAAQSATVSGPVDKAVYGAAESVTVGSIVGSVDVRTNSLTLGNDAHVNGDLTYTSEDSLTVDKTKVTGSVTHHVPPQRERTGKPANPAAVWFGWWAYWLAAALVTGLVLALLAPRLVGRVTQVMVKRPGASIGWGLLVAIVTPIVALLLMFTVIGIPLALLMLAVWALALVTSGVFAGIAFGRWLLERADWRKGSLVWAAVVGIILSAVVFSIPFLGGLIGLVASWWALGGLALNSRAVRG